MNVEIGTEAALFPEKEYKKGIFIAVSERNGIKWSQEKLKGWQKTLSDANKYWQKALSDFTKWRKTLSEFK